MRVKRPVDFRMAPKKAIKQKGVVAKPTQVEGCNTSKCSQSDLESLVKQDVLSPSLLSNGVLPWGRIIRMKILGKLLLSPHSWNGNWGFLVLLSFLDSCAVDTVF